MDDKSPLTINLIASPDRRRLLILTRRTLLAAMALSILPGEDLFAGPGLGAYPFRLGVASGDPEPDGILIWTRLAPDPLADDGLGGMPNREVPVRWQVATDEGMTDIVAEGIARASPSLAHSVHVEVRGLRPARPYFYRFGFRGEDSHIGRTMTAPALGARLDLLKFAYASCQEWSSGFYTAYRHMAEEDIDLVLHLGDYIYEGGIPANGGARGVAVPASLRGQAMTLAQFRLRYSLYKSDPDLQEAHRRFPFVCIWDDHEVENDYAGLSLQSGETSLRRRAAGYQAYYENLPLRATWLPNGSDMRIYRRMAFGDLVTFNMLDARQYRSAPPCGQGVVPRCEAPGATMLGKEQEEWLRCGLVGSGTRWNVLGQQVLMAQFDHDLGPGKSIWSDAWDPYSSERRRILDLLRDRRVDNPVVLTGDWHSTFANELKADFDDPKSPPIAVEFVTPALTSGGDAQPYGPRYGPLVAENPHISFFEGDRRGYFRAVLTREAWRTEVRYVSRVGEPTAGISTGASFLVEDGVPKVQII